MKEITYFYMNGCPYCRQAEEAIRELKKDHKELADVAIRRINENEHPEIADKYDYYYVPTMYIGGEKLYEAHPGESYKECKAKVQSVMEASIGDAAAE